MIIRLDNSIFTILYHINLWYNIILHCIVLNCIASYYTEDQLCITRSCDSFFQTLARPIFEGKDSLDQVKKIIGVLGCQAHEDVKQLCRCGVKEQGEQHKIRFEKEHVHITVDKTHMIIYDYVISMSISYNIVFQVLRWWSCSSWLHSKKHFTRPYSSQPNGYGYAISHYSWKGSFWITNSVDAHLMREHQTEVLKHFHPPGSSSVSSWGFFLVRPPVFLALLWTVPLVEVYHKHFGNRKPNGQESYSQYHQHQKHLDWDQRNSPNWYRAWNK